MARQGIFTGFTPNDGLGDSLAAGAVKVNDNFLEIYQTFGDGINLSANAGSAGTWAKVAEYGISTSKYVGIGTELPTSQLHVAGNTLLAGITTGTFVGDGSGLTGVTATGSGVVIKDNGTLIGVAQSINFGQRLDVGQVFGGNVTIDAVDYVSYANLSGVSSYTAVAGYSSVTDYSPLAGVSSYTPNAGVATYAQSAGIVTYAAASGVATNAGVSEYAKLAGVSTYAGSSGISTVSGYASTSGIATVAQNLTGTPSINIDNINSAIGIVTMPGQGSKMRFDFDATGDLPASTSWRGMFAYANNVKRAYVSTGTTMGGYNGWRQILHQDEYGNYFTVGIITASRFSGDGSGLTNLPSTDSIWRSNSTGINTLGKVGIGTTTCVEALNITGNINLDGRMDGTATNNTLPFLWATYSSLPQATDYHGQFAHAHDMGKAYFAHAGRWVELVDRAVDGTVGTSTDNYIVGVITATEFSGTISGLTSTANINTTGVITATKFVGDGSGLTNLPGGGGGGGVAGVVVQEEGSTVGTAGTINFVGAGMTATLSAGVATVHVTSSGIQVETDPIFVSSAAYTITGIQTSQWSSAYSWGNHASQGYLSGSSNLDALNNVSNATPSTNQVLKWNGSAWAPANESGGGGVSRPPRGWRRPLGRGRGRGRGGRRGGGGGGSSSLIVKEEGTQVASAATSINFVGSDVTATASGTDVTVTFVSGGGGAGLSTTGFGTYTAAAGVEEQIDSFNASSYSGAEYTVMIGLGTYRQSQKLMVMHDGTTAYSQEYAIMSTPEPQVSIGATLDSGNVLIKVTPLAGISGLSTYRFIKTSIQGI